MHFLSLWILPLIHGEENTTWNDHSLLSIPRPLLSSSSRITHILFGSCNNEDKPQTIWPLLQDLKPHVWIFLGDNVRYLKVIFIIKVRPIFLLDLCR